MLKEIIPLLIFCFSLFNNCNAQNSSNLKIDNQWFIEFESKDIGSAKTVFYFNIEEDDTFTAHTRKNALKDALGFWKSSLARIFTSDFKNGAFLNITDGILEQKKDTIILKGIFRSAMGNYYFNGKVVNDSLKAELTTKNGEKRGILSGYSEKNIDFPLADYSKIWDELLEETKNKIYNPDIIASKEWKKFHKKMQKISSNVKDDIDMIFSFYYYADKLPISHYALVKGDSFTKNDNQRSNIKYTELEEKSENTAFLKIKSFEGSANEMNSVFSIIQEKKYNNLIVDLRDNQGGAVEAGLEFAKNVVNSTTIGGIFLTQKWFNNHRNIPEINDYDQFPHFSSSNTDLLIEGIHKEKGLVLKVNPIKNNYQGNLFILTNNNTASTCEPIVYSLKKEGRAKIIGEKTAGAMLNGESFELSEGYSLIVPTADYYTIDGYKIDQNGVDPDIKINAEQALNYVLDNLIK